ncbi:MAG: hypothetical protein WD229_13475, partial [Pirellulales bacterium]
QEAGCQAKGREEIRQEALSQEVRRKEVGQAARQKADDQAATRCGPAAGARPIGILVPSAISTWAPVQGLKRR